MELNEKEEEMSRNTNLALKVLEEWGNNSRFIWFRELHRISDIEKGVLRNIINDLKKSKEIQEMHGTNNRIFFCLRKYYKKCYDVEFRFKGKPIMLRDGSKVKIIQGETNATARTRKRIEKQQKRRQVKSRSRIKQRNMRPHKS
ncbi:hypothetical protein BG20_I1967 [Candidatus Nitrosarchaeum limnium BG20]|uniref:Uncharacterized protein n=1 Tax=Candidatus Nitrosarchaeum limnium BG20 TaxID=859192 RepID=S2DZU3_9ARCH|nr:hypothetical protein [Candidatus Nitrosarchaeum limnium]EPA04620.1 hypothetical protein BG20_I1967 [Candidatus Nitrosarchaeum limnium BG20]